MPLSIHETINSKGELQFPKVEPDVADICLFLEGTYPYISGGVSGWVHSLIKGLPEFTFSLFLILPEEKEHDMKYEVPTNVSDLFILYLNRSSYHKNPVFKRVFSKKILEEIVPFHEKMPNSEEYDKGIAHENETTCRFAKIAENANQEKWNIPSMLFSKKIWSLIQELYDKKQRDCSFLDYFLTWKYLHASIFSILKCYVPPAKVYHTISTGYAGLVASRASILKKTPLLVTEHGIYSKERKIEISRSPWIYEKKRHLYRAEGDVEHFKEIWIDAFRLMSKICYDTAEEIITIYGGNQRFEIEDGAEWRKMSIIPNGVPYEDLSILKPEPQKKKIIGFVGRIVPIKDVKTFIRAVGLVLKSVENAEAWLMGPTEEDEKYYHECRDLVEHLEISEKAIFMGSVNLKEYYPKLDVLILTSISEAQPLVILEAHCLGIPVVASDVGGCRELLEGMEGEDAALGKSGFLTGLANPTETALSIISLLKDDDLRRSMGEVGRQRVKRFYDMPLLFARYHSLYHKYMNFDQVSPEFYRNR